VNLLSWPTDRVAVDKRLCLRGPVLPFLPVLYLRRYYVSLTICDQSKCTDPHHHLGRALPQSAKGTR